MKKILATLSFVVLAASVQAASIDWTVSGLNKVLTDYSGSTAAGTTVYLILADSSSLASITSTDSKTLTKQEFEDALSAITIATVSSGTDGKKPATVKNTVESDLITAGSTYQMASIYLSPTSDSIYFRSSGAVSGTAYDPKVEGASGGVGTSWATMSAANWTKGAAVPEPSTAVLALAGLALLLKRRRA